jgi:glycosyltransferase involved in cell wall biosynthesis
MFDPAYPRISVCIPTFNGASTIHETVSSVLAQTFTDFELVICDDASSDSTIEILSQFSDPRIKVHQFEKAPSAAGNWNRAMNLCLGQYIKIMGQDDLLYVTCLQAEVLAMTTHEVDSPSFVYSSRDIILPSGRRVKPTKLFKLQGSRISDSKKLIRKVIRSGRNPIGEPVAVTIRRESYFKTTSFQGSYVIDLDMWLQLLEFGPAVKISEVLSAFRVSRSSWSFRLRRTQATETIALLESASAKYLHQNSSLNLQMGKLMAHIMQVLRSIVLAK